VHDTDHPGIMNGFLTATRHPLAIAYDDMSVLENHHISMALALLDLDELNFLSPLSLDRQQEMRAVMRNCVMATDITAHGPLLKEFETLGSSASNLHNEIITMQVFIKASDISNPARPLAVYQQWVGGVIEEFFTQGDRERDLGLKISMNCDRRTVKIPNSQVGFINFLVKPLFVQLCTYLPELRPIALAHVEKNLAHYQAAAAT